MWVQRLVTFEGASHHYYLLAAVFWPILWSGQKTAAKESPGFGCRISNKIKVNNDTYYMQQALACAEEAKKQQEIPVGAILVVNNHVIASAYNQTIAQCDPTAHAEILVLRQAAKLIKNHRLLEATLYVTLEPCPMCVGAMIQARIKRLVFAAPDQRLGALGSLFNILQTKGINHHFSVTEGPLAHESAQLLKEFFLQRRRKKS